ncbi:winged helix-turn-helix transcriptional regulator [Rhodococcus triatomae]|uniref:DNA-binding transcriptional regulator, MarR family n=1 Tax=Rhodococcus triatomae TaxID=300028 RepID=A0A1G8GC36_9NOCA|nr:MarR family winged helix-turn-helix transcriptional regulator [Rhodococcus triatomae]QNG20425.1 winged helix-turn-helix transcriptional regulator [Rhodococcus triatomae]QNG23659.1 winged helix-turn-helix transcriptional regulator [Rhodococcus triatomae]SDH91958.1 DNA-binding transcriptional regulator, MarR family [Rhodococcus triatomae]
MVEGSSGRVPSDRRSRLEAEISADLREVTAVSEQIGRVFAATHDLGHNDFHALMHIMVAETGGRPLRAGELGSMLGLSPAAMTYLVERLLASGHIRREADPSDRRRVLLRYDTQGLEVAREFFAPLGARTTHALRAVPDDDLAAAHRVFTVLVESMRAHHDELGATGDRGSSSTGPAETH